MKNTWKRILLALSLVLALVLSGCSAEMLDLLADLNELSAATITEPPAQEEEGLSLDEDGHYTSGSEVGLYLYLYGHLPDNFITKDEARDLGWKSSEGNLWEVAPGMSIGGDRFGNYEGNLPKGKTYYECDIDYEGGYRGEKRIVYSKDGYIYYTEDHYESFYQLFP